MVQSMLNYDPIKRPSVDDLLDDPWFKEESLSDADIKKYKEIAEREKIRIEKTIANEAVNKDR